MSGEASSRTSLDLPGRQEELVKAVHATGTPTVVVLMNGRPLTVGWVAENVPAILEAWFAGTQAGHAIADALFGDVNPGGKLPVTFPRWSVRRRSTTTTRTRGRPPDGQQIHVEVHRRPVTPLYPFGYGLSYTQFRLTDLRLGARRIRPDGALTAEVDVENIGKCVGDEVVQLYIHRVAASVTPRLRS